MFIKVIIFIIIFCIFVELYVGSILVRLDSTNQYTINLLSMGNFLIHPLYNSFLWNPELWIVNFPLMISFFILINLILDNQLKLLNNGILKGITSNPTPTDITPDF